ncbi:MAG: HYR domain-containing protein [Lewinellaceae bacterium]|nr:HYR domain-containing protein [Lewinellaceae bacterium]
MQKTYSLNRPIIFLGLLVLTVLFVQESKASPSFPLTDTLEISLSAAPTGCLNGTDGLITVNITGGMPPYNVEVSPEIKRRTVYNSITLPGILPGTYDVSVTDQLGAQAFGTVTVDTGTAPPIPDSLFVFTMLDGCLTECQGSLDINLEPGYIFRWNGRTMISDTLKRLCAGDHLLQVERLDQNCIINFPVNLPEPSNEEALPLCPGDTTIQIDPDQCAAVFDYGLQDWGSQPCGVGKDFLATTEMVDDGYGLAGTMFDLKNLRPDTLVITGWDLLLDEGTWDIQVYQTRISPTFVGNTFNGVNAATNLNWRFMGQTTVSSDGVTTSTHIPLGGIILPPNSSSGIYITSTRDWINGPISLQESTPSAEISNCDLQLSAGIGLTNRAGLGFAQGQGDLIFGNATQSGGNNNSNYRLIEANIYYVPLNKDIFQIDGTGLSSLSSFPVGSTLQALSFLNDGKVEDAVCSFTVNVVEPTPPTFTTCPTDISVTADQGDCSAIVQYDLPTFTDNCTDRELVLTLNKTDEITSSARCYNAQTGESPQSSHIRVFDLQNHNMISPFELTNVAVGVAESNGTEAVTLNIYEIHPDSALTYANMDLVQTQSFTPPAGSNFIQSVNLSATVQHDRNLVVEMIDPAESEFIAGYTEEGNGTSYFVGCGFPEPTDLLDINCIRRHFYVEVTGNSSLVLTMDQTDSTGLSSGDLFPGGTTVQEFTATDASGNTAVCSFQVTVVNDINLSLEPTSTSCATNEGAVTTTVEGGLQPYTYLWNTGSTEQNLTALSPGTYSVTLTDANGCTSTAQTVVEGDLAPSFASVNMIPALCGNNNGAVEVSAEGVNGPFVYAWSTGSTDTIVQDLGPGIYSVTVTDTLGCVAIEEIEVTEIPGPSVATISALPTYCGNDNGSVEVVAEGDNGPFTYAWSTGSTDSVAVDLGPGAYQVTITDTNGCSTTDEVTVEEIPGPELSVTTTVPTICGGADGTAEVVPSGNAPFTYEWNTGATDSLITGLVSTGYSVSVIDGNGCITTQDVIVEDPPGPDLTFESTLPSGCIIPDGTASVTPAGDGPFSYIWENGETDSLALGLLPGLYDVTVTDGKNCVTIGEVQVEAPDGPALTVQTTVPTSCLAEDGIAEVAAEGVWPYTFIWSNGQTDSIATGLAAGAYTIQVFDAVGCMSTAEVVLEVATDLAISDQVIVASSCGEPNGSIQVVVGGGDGPYSYAWSHGGLNEPFQENLAAGTYDLTVTDSLGCVVSESFVVDDQGSPQIDSIDTFTAYCGLATGAAEVFISGGSGNYFIEWSNGVTEPANTDLTPGAYSITVTDTNGCETFGDITIEDVAGQTAAITVVQQPTACVGADGALEVQVEGGVAPYSITWNTGATDTLLENIPPGDYSAVVVDAAGCEVTATITLISLNGIELDWSANNATCGNDNGTVIANVGGGEGAIQYEWSFNGNVLEGDTVGQPVLLFTGLEGGNYQLVLTDSTGCEEVAQIEVVQAGVPVITAGFLPSTCGQSNGQAWAEISGGTYPYTFIWDNGSTDSLLTNVPAGEYALAILDDNNCLATGTVTVEDLLAPQVTAAEILPATCSLQNGQITLDVISSTPEFTILWSNGDSTLVIDSLEASTYSVVVTDQNGCESILTGLEVTDMPDTIAPEFAVCPVDMEVHSCDSTIVYDQPEAVDNCGLVAVEQIEGLPSGASFPTDTTFITYQAGDAFGNTSTCSFAIVRIEDLAAESVWEDVSCFGDSDGTAGLTVSGGTAPYAILWSTGDTTETIEALTPGTYTATITDQGACEILVTVDVAEPAPISVALDSIIMETPPCENGGIYISPSGGTPPFTFEWTNLDSSTVVIGDSEDLGGLFGGAYECRITDANGCVQTTATFIVQQDAGCVVSTLEREALEAAVTLWPNPTNGLLTVQLTTPQQEDLLFALYDARGVELTRFLLPEQAEPMVQLDLSAYPTGMYWLRIQAGSAVIARKVVLTR